MSESTGVQFEPRSTPQAEDPHYREYLRSFGCELGNTFSSHECRGKLDIHHYPFRGRKKQGDDRCALCVCHDAHIGVIHGYPGFPPREFESRVEFEAWQVALQFRRMREYLDAF